MRVCQFRHYGTVFYAPHRGPEHANREPLVFQTPWLLSMLWEGREFTGAADFGTVGTLERQLARRRKGETYTEK